MNAPPSATLPGLRGPRDPLHGMGRRDTTPSSPGTASRAPAATWTTSPRTWPTLSRHLPGHPRPRPVAMEPPAGEGILPRRFMRELAGRADRPAGARARHWLGTSMGGAIGMRRPPAPLKGRIRRLVLNDIGPSSARRRSSASAPMREIRRGSNAWASWRSTSAPSTSLRLALGRAVAPAYRDLDPPHARRQRDAALRPGHGAAVRSTTRGLRPVGRSRTRSSADAVPARRDSDLLLPETAEEMRTRGPARRGGHIAGCGHAPALNVPDQIRSGASFLAGG